MPKGMQKPIIREEPKIQNYDKEKVFKFLTELEKQNYSGSLEMKFQFGRVTYIWVKQGFDVLKDLP